MTQKPTTVYSRPLTEEEWKSSWGWLCALSWGCSLCSRARWRSASLTHCVIVCLAAWRPTICLHQRCICAGAACMYNTFCTLLPQVTQLLLKLESDLCKTYIDTRQQMWWSQNMTTAPLTQQEGLLRYLQISTFITISLVNRFYPKSVECF